jgi:hypothetical protein
MADRIFVRVRPAVAPGAQSERRRRSLPTPSMVAWVVAISFPISILLRSRDLVPA